MLEHLDNSSTTFLATKLIPLPARSDLIPRLRLYEKLNQGLTFPLTLVLAPAGFGKTSLVSGWLRSRNQPAAWITLDPDDNDPARFWAYFTRALDKAYPFIHNPIPISYPFPALLPQEANIASEANLASLINLLAAMPDEMAVVLDDFHLITAPIILERIAYLIEHLPPNLHLFLVSRSDPLLPLPRMRARRQVCEIRTVDLRFTPDEAADFLNRVMGLNLKPEDVEVLANRTEGWIAGLQLAALSLLDRQDIRAVIGEITGDDRYIQDYLVDEVFLHQPADIQQFMLQTSILDRFTAPLCEALTGRSDSQAILERMERSNLFIIPLDTSRRWYRYHQLLADMLRSRLARESTGQVEEAHRRAAAWYLANQDFLQAVAHYLAGQDIQAVTAIIESRAKSMLLENDMSTLMAWFKAMPDTAIRKRPELCILYAWTLVYNARFAETEDYLVIAEAGLGQEDGSGISHSLLELDTWLGQIDAMRGTVALNFGDIRRGFELSQRALERLPDSEAIWRGLLGLNLGDAYVRFNQVDEAKRAFEQGITASRLSGNLTTLLVTYGSQASLFGNLGQLQEAEAIFKRALAAVPIGSGSEPVVVPALGKIHAFYADLLYEWNRLDEAGEQARLGIERCTQWGHLEHMVDSYLEAAAIYRAQSSYDDALGMLARVRGIVADTRELLNQPRQADPNPIIQRTSQRIELAWVEFYFLTGNFKVVSEWIDQNSPLFSQAPGDFTSSMLLARWLIHTHKSSEAIDWLNRWREKPENKHRVSQKMTGFILLSLAGWEMSDEALAFQNLDKALRLGEPQGYIRTFVDEGEALKQLISVYYSRMGETLDPSSREYLNKLLASFPPSPINKDTAAPGSGQILSIDPGELIEPLSQREIWVLRLVAAGQTNQEIAETLVISVNTVKTHLKRIYAKLSTSNRVEAVERGHKLRLI